MKKKRKHHEIDDTDPGPEQVEFIPTIKKIVTLSDLIKVILEWKKKEHANETLTYTEIEYSKLTDALPQLRQLNNLVGMDRLKREIVKQVLFFVQGLHAGDMMNMVMTGDPGVGKCHGKDTPIIMYDGSVKMVQDIVVGDQLMGNDSTPRNVLSLARGREQMYRVEQEIGDSYIVNESHILSLKLGSATQNVSIKNYLAQKKRYRKYLKGYKTHIDFPEQKVPIDPYDYGRSLPPGGRLPQEYKINTVENRLQLLQGLFNGPLPHYGMFKIVQEDYNLSKDIEFVARSVGFDVKLKRKRGLCRNDVYVIYIYTNRTKTTKIKLEKLGVDDYYGFEIDGNHLYVLGDFTVTHNTTVCHILAKIYCKLGVLSHGHFRIATRSDLIGEYLGHTAAKTRGYLESCMGGVVLIDEAYSIGTEDAKEDTYSKECVDVLNQFLSDNRNIICILAGYKDCMEKNLFNLNQGLDRRFPWRFHMDTYSGKELADIFMYRFMKKNRKQMRWKTGFKSINIVPLFAQNKHLFKNNGGDCEKLVSLCKIAHGDRIFLLGESEKKESKGTLSLSDFKIGFNSFVEDAKKRHKPKTDIQKLMYI